MKDVQVDTYRASGAGGQHINKTDSAVRMTHKPTGIVVQCQSQRSQMQNREQALRLLRAKLFELELEKQAELKEQIGGTYQAIERIIVHRLKLVMYRLLWMAISTNS